MTGHRRKLRRPTRGGYLPPCCPNPHCSYHRHRHGWRFVRNGSFVRPSDHRRFRCFRCRHCGRRFSTRTFSSTYWLRRRDLLRPTATLACEGAALRQIARALGTSHPTVGRLLSRLGRHCLLFHTRLARDLVLAEPLVFDGFETYEFSQYFPFHLNLAVGAESWFLYHFTDSPLRRKGAMTPLQRQRRADLESALGRPDPKAIEHAIAALLAPLLARCRRDHPLVLHSDDHPAYRRALRRLPPTVPLRHCVTPSRLRRTQSNPLFPVNLTDLLLRHGSANHHRESIAFSKRRQAALERAAVFMVWRNCIKRRRENGTRETAAMVAGCACRPLTWIDVLRRRLFPKQTRLPAPWPDYYWRRIKTAALGEGQTTHAALYSY